LFTGNGCMDYRVIIPVKRNSKILHTHSVAADFFTDFNLPGMRCTYSTQQYTTAYKNNPNRRFYNFFIKQWYGRTHWYLIFYSSHKMRSRNNICNFFLLQSFQNLNFLWRTRKIRSFKKPHRWSHCSCTLHCILLGFYVSW
jgi:hypothetical protein